MTTKVKTFLPVFTGFYHTIFSSENEIENFLYLENLTDDDIDFDNKKYELDIVNGCIDGIIDNCQFIENIILEDIVSPKYYNFSNDSANVEIDIDLDAFKEYLFENESLLRQYIKGHYTSCSGFISSYPDNFDGWVYETENFTKLDGHYLGALLNFYFENERFTDDDLYYYLDLYIDKYIEILTLNVSDLDTYDKGIVLKNIIDTIDFDFGYMEIIKKEALMKCENLNETWEEYLINRYSKDLIEASKVKKVKSDLTPIYE
jgi:hypothetical protein